MTFIQNNLTDYSVSQLCSALKLPRSTYYKALVRVPSNKQKEYEEFGRKVKQAYEDSKQRYGAVKICRILNDNGTPLVLVCEDVHHLIHATNPDTIRKYMEILGLDQKQKEKLNKLRSLVYVGSY